jgi:hypothetical protein
MKTIISILTTGLVTVVDEGSRFNVIDTTPEGQMFYKVTVSEP